MADHFLREVKRMHQLRRDINEMTPEEADELIRGLGDDASEDWVFAARDAQLPPPDLSWCWLFLGGRSTGKSHSMSQAVHTAVRAGIKRIHFIAQPRPIFTMSTSKARAVYSRPAAVIHGRVGCRRGDGWNGQTAQCACSSRARSRNRCAGRKRKW